MAYDRALAERIRAVLQGESDVAEKAMFGGLAFLVNGHLAVSAGSKGGLLLRVDPAESESLVSEPYVSRYKMRGREMTGWLGIEAEALATDDALRSWVARGVGYARSLPAK
jgi:TfoX/Sxy family transcriptional regulator of competence genes